MLTGTKAFTGDTPIHVAYQHVHGGVPVPSDRVPGLPPALDDLVAVATARDPDERPTDAADFLALVRRTRATLSTGRLDARPAGAAAAAAASVPTATAALPVQPRAGAVATARGPRRGAAVATRSRSEHTTAMTVPPAPLEGVVVAGDDADRPRRWWPAIVASALVAALTAWFFVLGPGATATVPVGAGPRPGRGRRRRAHRVLDPRVSEAFDEKVPQGVVVSVQPGAGHRGAPGAPTSRSWSPRAPSGMPCPPVVGMTVAEATRADRGGEPQGRQGHRGVRREGPRGAGRLRQARPGRRLKKGTAVAMTVSKGRKPIEVPDFTGKSAETASRS